MISQDLGYHLNQVVCMEFNPENIHIEKSFKSRLFLIFSFTAVKTLIHFICYSINLKRHYKHLYNL